MQSTPIIAVTRFGIDIFLRFGCDHVETKSVNEVFLLVIFFNMTYSGIEMEAPTAFHFGTSIMAMRVPVTVLLIIAVGVLLNGPAFAGCLMPSLNAPCCPGHEASPNIGDCHQFCLSVASGLANGIPPEVSNHLDSSGPVLPISPSAAIAPTSMLRPDTVGSPGSLPVFKRIHVFLI
jgi:hypothetical protein